MNAQSPVDHAVRAAGAGLPPEFRVLIVDDTPAIHEDFRKILSAPADGDLARLESAIFGELGEQNSRLRLEIDSADQGQSGLARVERALAENRPYSLAFVDIRMPPGWDGIETVERIWQVDPELQIVICTAYSDYSWDALTRRLGHSDNLVILKKPFDNIEVLQLTHALVEKWRLNRISKRQIEALGEAVRQRTGELESANRSLRQEIAERKIAVERLAAFSSLAQRLSAADTSKEAAQIIVEVADQLLGWDACICDLYDPDKDLVEPVLSLDLIAGRRTECPPVNSHRPPNTLSRRALREGALLVLRDDPKTMRPDGLPFGDTARPSASLMFVPIRHGQRATGVLSIQSYAPKAYDANSLKVFQVLADYCGGALDRIRSTEVLRATQEQLRQIQKLEAIGQLAGGVAHDFNNLLAVIRGNAELALMDSVPREAARDCITQITAAADRAANLTRQLLAFGRKQVMQAQPLLLNDLIVNLAKMLKRIIGENINLQCHYTTGLPLVHADPGMIEQALINLVINSRDAMPNGGHLHVSTEECRFSESDTFHHPEARPGAFVCVSVRDTGAGIVPEHLPHIFEPFFTTKPVGKGTGLGLATVYGIVKQHKGWAEVISQPGEGSTFRLYLPVLPDPAPTGSENRRQLPPQGGTETILLVEDDEAVRALTRRLLQNFGYQVCEASRPSEALDIWDRRAAEIKLLVTDLVMPDDLNGRDLAVRLWEQDPTLKVVFMSGYSPDVAGRDTDFFRRNGSCFLPKPCPSRTLLATIRHCLDNRS